MIFHSHHEIKEIYIGSVPISSVYIGNRLIWRSRVYMEAGALIVMPAAVSSAQADGVPYITGMVITSAALARPLPAPVRSIEHADVGLPLLHASPYMRHIFPMLIKLYGEGISEPFPQVIPSDTIMMTENGVFLHTVGADMMRSATTLSGHEGSGFHNGILTPSRGCGMPVTAYGSPVLAVRIANGDARTLCDAYVPDAVFRVAMTGGTGKVTRDLYAANAVYRLSGIIHGGGEAFTQMHMGCSVYRIRLKAADGTLRGAGSHSAALYEMEQMYGAVENGSIRTPFACSSWTNTKPSASLCEPVGCAYEHPTVTAAVIPHAVSETLPLRGVGLMPAGAFISGKSAVTDTPETIHGVLPAESVTAGTGSMGGAVGASPSVSGMCSVSMTTENYTESVDFDTMPIADMDALSVSEIDALKILI